MNKHNLKEDILKIIYQCSTANYFKVDNTSYLYKQVDDTAERLASFISSKQDVIKAVCECVKPIPTATFHKDKYICITCEKWMQ